MDSSVDALPPLLLRRGQCGRAQGARDTPDTNTRRLSSPFEFEIRARLGRVATDERLEQFRKHVSQGASLDFHFRMMVAKIIMSSPFEWAVGVIVFAQLGMATVETDHSAMSKTLPTWVHSLQIGFVATYVVELALRIYVWRRHFFHNFGNQFDLTVVALDLGAVIAEAMFHGDIPTMTILRCLRLVKLVRTARVLRQFRELYVIASSFAGVLKSIFWESVLLFVVLTLASIVAVELIHPISLELFIDGTYDGCDRCPRAFESVMQSNLTFFQVLIAGDSWGLVIIPIIERRPETALFFVILTLCVVVGLMNLILSAIVDKATQVRQIVEATSLMEKRAVINESKLKLVSVCEELDVDKNGSLTQEELSTAISSPVFQEALKVMEVGQDDLDTMFRMMDVDSSGAISYAELADSLQKIKSEDDHMLLLIIQRTLKDCSKKLTSQHDIQARMQDELAAQKQHLHRIGKLMEEETRNVEHVFESEEFRLVDTSIWHQSSPRVTRRLPSLEASGVGELGSTTAGAEASSCINSRSNRRLSRSAGNVSQTGPAESTINIEVVDGSDAALVNIDAPDRSQNRGRASICL